MRVCSVYTVHCTLNTFIRSSRRLLDEKAGNRYIHGTIFFSGHVENTRATIAVVSWSIIFHNTMNDANTNAQCKCIHEIHQREWMGTSVSICALSAQQTVQTIYIFRLNHNGIFRITLIFIKSLFICRFAPIKCTFTLCSTITILHTQCRWCNAIPVFMRTHPWTLLFALYFRLWMIYLLKWKNQ